MPNEGRGLTKAARRKMRPGDFVFPDDRRWPINTKARAMTAIRYMHAGRGKPSDYPTIGRAIRRRWGHNRAVMDELRRLKPKTTPRRKPKTKPKANPAKVDGQRVLREILGESRPNPDAPAKRNEREVLDEVQGLVAFPFRWYAVPGEPRLKVHRAPKRIARGKVTALGTRWVITHRLSGMALPGLFRTKAKAMAAAKRARKSVPDVPWRWFHWHLASDWTRGQVQKFAREVARHA